MLRTIRQAFGLIDVSNRPWIFGYLAANVVASFLDASGLILIFAFFQVVLRPDDLDKIWALATLRQWMGNPAPEMFLAVLGGFVALAFFLRMAILLLVHWLSLMFRRRLQRRLMGQVFRSYLRRPLSWHHAVGIPRIVNGLRLHVPAVCLHIVVGALEIVANLITFCVLVATMMWLRPVETLSVIAVLAAFCSLYFFLIRKRLLLWAEQESKASEGTWAAVNDPLSGIRIVKIHALEEFFARRLDAANDELLDIASRKSMLKTAPPHILQLTFVVGMIAAIVIAFVSGSDVSALIPTIILFSGAALRLIPLAISMLNEVQSIRATQPGLGQLREDYMQRQAEEDRPADSQGSFRFESISLENVSFVYASDVRAAPAIDAVTIRLAAGDRLALTGPSGAGKSTLVELMMGLLKPSSGRVSVNGTLDGQLARDLFSYVPQETVLVKDSFARNIALGDAPIDAERLHKAIAGAILGPVVARLPQGAQTRLGAGGDGLSGGERQRIGIARALYRDAPVIVMDEPTSALDALTEADIAATLDGLKGQRTIVLIAHRLSTVRNFERIVFMEAGRILQQGSFEDLYAGQKHFRAMADLLMAGSGRNDQ